MGKPHNRVGISGWTFPAWRGTFYPKDVTQKKELEFASRALTSIEINGTFYALQRPTSFQKWHDETPKDFQFAVKAPQFMTHVLRLKEFEEPLANFFASGLLCLGEKLGPILWQFPPFVTLKDDRFARFLKALPHDSKSAVKIAKNHGGKVEGRAYTKVQSDFPVRHAFEFRHKSFLDPKFIELMRKHNVAFVTAHATTEKSPYLEIPTADFVYARLHGAGKKYAKGYTDAHLVDWVKKITVWNEAGLDTFTYFSNEAKIHSPKGAMTLLKKLKK